MRRSFLGHFYGVFLCRGVLSKGLRVRAVCISYWLPMLVSISQVSFDGSIVAAETWGLSKAQHSTLYRLHALADRGLCFAWCRLSPPCFVQNRRPSLARLPPTMGPSPGFILLLVEYIAYDPLRVFRDYHSVPWHNVRCDWIISTQMVIIFRDTSDAQVCIYQVPGIIYCCCVHNDYNVCPSQEWLSADT